MGKQLSLDAPGMARPPPTEDQRLNARLASGMQEKRARREGKRTIDVRCPACGEKIVVIP
jgi:hypothetical protein